MVALTRGDGGAVRITVAARSASDRRCRDDFYGAACVGRREKTCGGGRVTWALGGHGVPTCEPRRGKRETDMWDPAAENSRIKNTSEMKIAQKIAKG
jgi:hypothetical protein